MSNCQRVCYERSWWENCIQDFWDHFGWLIIVVFLQLSMYDWGNLGLMRLTISDCCHLKTINWFVMGDHHPISMVETENNMNASAFYRFSQWSFSFLGIFKLWTRKWFKWTLQGNSGDETTWAECSNWDPGLPLVWVWKWKGNPGALLLDLPQNVCFPQTLSRSALTSLPLAFDGPLLMVLMLVISTARCWMDVRS